MLVLVFVTSMLEPVLTMVCGWQVDRFGPDEAHWGGQLQPQLVAVHPERPDGAGCSHGVDLQASRPLLPDYLTRSFPLLHHIARHVCPPGIKKKENQMNSSHLMILICHKLVLYSEENWSNEFSCSVAQQESCFIVVIFYCSEITLPVTPHCVKSETLVGVSAVSLNVLLSNFHIFRTLSSVCCFQGYNINNTKRLQRHSSALFSLDASPVLKFGLHCPLCPLPAAVHGINFTIGLTVYIDGSPWNTHTHAHDWGNKNSLDLQ